MTNEEIWEKFNDCAETGGMPRADILPLFERLETLEKAPDIRMVARLMLKRALPGKGAPAAGFIDTSADKSNPNVLKETSWVP
jgi:hypothetical protein